MTIASNRRLILASGSPRRKMLLSEAGYEFDVVPPNESAEQGVCSDCSPAELVVKLAVAKAADVVPRVDAGVIIAADTVAECQGQILGKPRDADHARAMLELMSDQVHRVLTGVCIWTRPDNKVDSTVEITELRMDRLDPTLIDAYIESDQWIGKAGGFGYQDGLDWVHIIKGSESNVVGLPLETLKRMLAATD